jgi:hypothetical protein
MHTQLKNRLVALKTEFESGQKMLVEIEAKQAKLRDSLLRLSGAIQVLEEELAQAESSEKANLISPDAGSES